MRNPQEPRDALTGHLDDESVSDCAFSPELAAPGALEHAAGCGECAARIEELTAVLASLAELPEPEIPESVLIRLDATVERAWQQADAEELERSAAARRPRGRRGWRRLTVPITALGVLTGAIAGVGYLVGQTGSANNSAASASTADGAVPNAAANHDATLQLMAQQALGQSPRSGATVTYGLTTPDSASAAAAAPSTRPVHPDALQSTQTKCAPAKAGYTAVALAPETYAGAADTVVVYRESDEPASTTTFYAVLYAGSCPSSTSTVLLEGLVSVSR